MKQFSIATYTALRSKVREVLLLGQRKIDQARVETYWNAGRYIHEHLLFHKDRAEYGDYTLSKLSEDLGVGKRLFERVLRFYLDFPSIASARTQLSWTHYRTLSGLRDEKKRLELTRRALKEDWTTEDLQLEVRNQNWNARVEKSDGKAPSLLPVPVLGPFYTYKIIRPETVHSSSKQLLLDLGFSARLEMELFPGAHFPAGTILESKRRDEDEKGAPKHAPIARGYSIFKLARSEKGEGALYTYKAFVQRFIDADTYHVEFRLGFGQIREETIRLKGTDCPEMNTPEGRAAKSFVERELGACEFITVKSSQTRKEKWGRYLGDIFYQDKSGKQVYLNNLLLEKGHAVRVRY
ncbi:MAG: thermonuclease family protein [Candidatus Omnitrophica bacterium]|nr:thermonuclease family protein [Candidatus Omnitrophota bacterium]